MDVRLASAFYDSIFPLSPVRSALTERTQKNTEECSSYLSLMANKGVIPYAEKGDVGNKKPDDLSKCKVVQVGDFVINSMNFMIGSFGRSKYAGICSPVYIVASPNSLDFDPRFVMYIFQLPTFQSHVGRLGTGLLAHRMAVGWDELKGQLIPAPPLPTQTAIADYLDRKTAAIDALIAKKEQLIEELRKYQEAVIAEAVAPREWWRMLPAKRLFTRRREKNRPEAQLLTASINHGVVPKASLSFKTNEPVHTDLALYQLVRPGDFVLSLATFESGLEYAQCEGIISPAYTVVTPVDGLHAEFYRYYLKSSSFIAELYPFRKGIRQGQSISYEDFGSLQIPVPSLAEQECIAARLSKHNAKQSKLMRNLAATLAELKAYRASIIAEAVAGRGNLEQNS